jgi:hypothetical protein
MVLGRPRTILGMAGFSFYGKGGWHCLLYVNFEKYFKRQRLIDLRWLSGLRLPTQDVGRRAILWQSRDAFGDGFGTSKNAFEDELFSFYSNWGGALSVICRF